LKSRKDIPVPEKPYVIALEEHYIDRRIAETFKGRDATRAPHILAALEDLVDTRIKEMDAAGIDLQVLSHGAPAVQRLDDSATAIRLARLANDSLHETACAHPKRFAGFAMLPTADAKAAADELERTVTKLGFKGAMIHGLANGHFLDDKRFWPIFERAQALDVPIYLHPSAPHEQVVEVYYKDYLEKWPTLQQSAWGFGVETGTLAIRLVLSGLFDAFPRTKIILGHLGEGIPFSLWRINQSLSRQGGSPSYFRDHFCEHFYITTSGFFSTPALQCCMTELGSDRIMFSVDYPFVANKPGVDWLVNLPLNAEDVNKIAHGNAQRLLKL
jgi:predicted TIM-barrel fold metal-dependent hydrolase